MAEAGSDDHAFGLSSMGSICDPAKCYCADGKTCHERMQEYMIQHGMQLSPITIENAEMFHLNRVDPSVIASLHGFKDDFVIQDVFNVSHPLNEARYQECKLKISAINGGDPNEGRVYHVSNSDPIKLCSEGLNVLYSRGGNFGKGIYLTNSQHKANLYSQQKGNGEALRIMYQLDIIMGCVKEYRMGQTDHDFNTKQCGFHSVKGYVNSDQEIVVYNNAQVIIKRVIFYRYPNTYKELTPQKIFTSENTIQVIIPPNLRKFIMNLIAIANTAEKKVAIRKQIKLLFTKAITPDEFLDNVSVIINAVPPPEIRARFIQQFNLSTLQPSYPAAAPFHQQPVGIMTPAAAISPQPPSAADNLSQMIDPTHDDDDDDDDKPDH